EITERVGLGPEADFALREGGSGDVRHGLFAIEKTTDPVADTLDGELMPEVGSNLDGRTDRVRVPSIDKFVKPEIFAQRAGPCDVIVLFILDAKSDTGHLFDRSAYGFEFSCQCKIVEQLIFKNE